LYHIRFPRVYVLQFRTFGSQFEVLGVFCVKFGKNHQLKLPFSLGQFSVSPAVVQTRLESSKGKFDNLPNKTSTASISLLV